MTFVGTLTSLLGIGARKRLMRVLDELDKHALCAGGVQESDQMSFGSLTRDPVDEFEALCLETDEFGCDVVGAVCEVMETWTPVFEETTDGRFLVQWLEEFHGADEGDADSMGL